MAFSLFSFQFCRATRIFFLLAASFSSALTFSSMPAFRTASTWPESTRLPSPTRISDTTPAMGLTTATRSGRTGPAIRTYSEKAAGWTASTMTGALDGHFTFLASVPWVATAVARAGRARAAINKIRQTM